MSSSLVTYAEVTVSSSLVTYATATNLDHLPRQDNMSTERVLRVEVMSLAVAGLGQSSS